jgi:tetratricopeptide (TPR) repeat protein
MSKLAKLLIAAAAGIICLGAFLIAVAGYYLLSYQKGSALFSDGVQAMDRRDYETAIVKFTAALEEYLPKQYRAHAFSDLAFSEEFDGRCEMAVRHYTEALRVDPDFALAYSSRGRLYQESGETDKALNDFSEAIRLDPNSHQAFFGRGLIDLERKNLDQAIQDFSEVVRTDPSAAFGYANRGLAYSYKRDFDHALANFDAALQLRPGNVRTLVQRGYVHYQMNERSKAIEDLTSAIELDPKSQPAYRMRASAYAHSGHYGKAIADFQKALELDANDTSALNDLAWLRATCAEARFRNGRQAVIEATAACKITNWKNASDIDTLAAAYAEAGDFNSAVSYQDQAIRGENVSEERLREMEQRKALYQSQKPFRELKAE